MKSSLYNAQTWYISHRMIRFVGDIVSVKKKDPSLSPLSKKMALHAQQMESSSRQQQHFHQPFYMSSNDVAENATQPQVIANEFKVSPGLLYSNCTFLLIFDQFHLSPHSWMRMIRS